MLTPSLLQSLKGIELIAREILSGYQTGMHPNVLKGAGQEFSQYRSYQPGDDLRQLDWKMYARSDRYYVRESENETNITVRFILDSSASMNHKEGELSKLDVARMLTAALSYLAVGQGDEVALNGLSDRQFYHTQRQQGQHHLQSFWQSLSAIKAEGVWPEFEKASSLPLTYDRKELCVVFSDMYEYESEILKLLSQLRSRGNEVVLFHLMGRKEYELDYKGNVRFEDLEQGESVQVNISKVKKEYLRQRDEFLKELQSQLLEEEILYRLVMTDEEPGEVIQGFVKHRQRL